MPTFGTEPHTLALALAALLGAGAGFLAREGWYALLRALDLARRVLRAVRHEIGSERQARRLEKLTRHLNERGSP